MQIHLFFQENTVDANNGTVEPVCHADPGSSEVDNKFQDRKSACNRFDDKQAVTLVMLHSSSGVFWTTLSNILVIASLGFRSWGMIHKIKFRLLLVSGDLRQPDWAQFNIYIPPISL